MFKLESYLTPYLLSYVDKYIKNFRPEDSQVSLWGGDASFHNLDLRLEVLEQEIQLPFSILSGHIHELLIHVPWTKLASEPIKITINTIECVLKLQDIDSTLDATDHKRDSRRKHVSRRQDIAAPPGYVQSLINKIVNNITINCNNLILKYIEEDIVVSINIKLLKFESANENWKAAYTDLSFTELIKRKLITLSDFTVCIDKRNAAGKIEVYQEPVLYRCFIEMRLFKKYQHSFTEKALNTRLDVHCARMEFSMTEQQLPMLMRIIQLLLALQQGLIKKETNIATNQGTSTAEEENVVNPAETWSGWAWNLATGFFPSEFDTDEEQNEANQINADYTFQIGLYIDQAIFTLKISEQYSNSNKGYNTNRKIKYHPLLCLQLNGCYSDTVLAGMEWCSVQMGIAEAILIPQGQCCCGIIDIDEETEEFQYYLKTGSFDGYHIVNSLFDETDANDDENERNEASPRDVFKISWDFYVATFTEAVMLEKTQAIAMDYLYRLEIPDDYSYEKISELGNDLEYSNLLEKSLCRFVAGPLKLVACSGLIHRLSTFQQVMNNYDYSPYKVLPPDPELSELHPPTMEDFDALNDSIPVRVLQMTFFKTVIEFQLLDHPKFTPTKQNLFRVLKKMPVNFPYTSVLSYPKVTLEYETLDVQIKFPIYPKRLVYTTCQLPEPPEEMFNACYIIKNVNITNISSQMVFSRSKRVTIILPFNIAYNQKTILFPKYWINPDTPHEDISTEIDNITLTGTKAKWMVVANIIENLSKHDTDEIKNSIFSSSLLNDAFKDSGMVVLEVYAENIKWHQISTISTVANTVSLDSLKAFILEPHDGFIMRDTKSPEKTNHHLVHTKKIYAKEPNQVLIISGPELIGGADTSSDYTLFKLTLQYPKSPEMQVHPALLYFNMGEMKVCFDPLLFRWLLYYPKNIYTKYDYCYQVDTKLSKPRTVSEGNINQRASNTYHESVHSSSERGKNIPKSSKSKYIEEEPQAKTEFFDHVFRWYPVWTNLIFFGDISQLTIYFPSKSLSAVGSQGIEDAIEMSCNKEPSADIIVMKLPICTLRSAVSRQSINSYLTSLPVQLPHYIWKTNRKSFPWSIKVEKFSCCTIQNKNKLCFLKPLSGNATVGLSVKYKNDKENMKTTNESTTVNTDATLQESMANISSFSVCVHIDNTPITIAFSAKQMCLITSILHGLMGITSLLLPESKIKVVNTVSSGKVPSDVQANVFSKEGFFDFLSEKTPTSPVVDGLNQDDDSNNIKFTIWVQWTITRLRIKLYGYEKTTVNNTTSLMIPPTLKLVFDMEDIMSSLDLQQVYMKFKSKIVTASIEHFKRKSGHKDWERGLYLGSVMMTREVSTNDRQDDCGFMSLTVTTARCGHVHNKWGASKKHRLAEMQIEQNPTENTTTTRYISEIVATLQAIDFILSPKTLKYFYLVLEPIITMQNISEPTNPSREPSSSFFTSINNDTLPLAYVDCSGFKFIILSHELNRNAQQNDVCIVEIGSINLLPTAENPICRIPVRPDLYQQAAQSRILNVPGSEIEDRQYQLNISSLSISTGSWNEFSQLLQRNINTVTALYTMNENPALEWNNLKHGKETLQPQFKLSPIMKKFNVCVVLAPSIIYKKCILVCGCSMEVNFDSDIEINLNLNHIFLLSTIYGEFAEFSNPVNTEYITKYQKFAYLNRITPAAAATTQNTLDESNMEYIRDSGVEITDANSEITVKTTESYPTTWNLNRDRPSDPKLNSDTKSSDYSMYTKFLNTVPFDQNQPVHCPVEILITGGHIIVSVFKILNDDELTETLNIQKLNKDTDEEYDASEEDSIEDFVKPQILPLLYIHFSQPNIFFSHLAFEKRINVSCFNFSLKTSASKYSYIEEIPSSRHYAVNLLNTKAGIPHKDTGIPPSFLSVKWVKGIGKNPALGIEFGRPIKVIYSYELLRHVLYIKEEILNCSLINTGSVHTMEQPKVNRPQNYTCKKFNAWQNSVWMIDNFDFKMSQIVFVFQTKSKDGLVLSFNDFNTSLMFSTRPERITNIFHVRNFTISTINNESVKLLLNPWSCILETCVFWESWQKSSSDPQIQVAIDSDCFILNVSTEEMNCLQGVLEECTDLMEQFKSDTQTEHEQEVIDLELDQYYKDDLRAGAFQFLDATSNEQPLPYQVMFWNEPVIAMAWRYPQPRILTKVRVFPVPFKNAENEQIDCYLQYWSDCHNCYKLYTKFQLSENEINHLKLPNNIPQPAVSSTWRVVLKPINYKHKTNISAFTLAACMRIDSYFNPNLVPQIQLLINISEFCINIHNQLKTNTPMVMPEKLRDYTPDGLIPDNQCFLILKINNPYIFGASWTCGIYTLELTTSLKCKILDYATLNLQNFIEPFQFSLRLNLAQCIDLNIVSEAINLKFNSAIAHTLAISTQLWMNNSEQPVTKEPTEMVIITRYVICNNTDVKLRFGQSGTDEDILLPSRFVHLYCWRSQKHLRTIKIAVEQNGWIWSKPFVIDHETFQVIELMSDVKHTLFLTIKSLSSTQKQIIICGQLIVCNMLLDHFELKLVPAVTENKDQELKNAKTHVVTGRNTTPFICVNLPKKYVLRLRFFNLESNWSGDIPLEENLKGSQPWLVKIPLQERGQFLSIWCRVLIQNHNKHQRILVMLWPLFMIRSNLPLSTNVKIETPSLNINLQTTVSGRGEIQQLYCPGTIDHSHQLVFEVNAEYSGNDSYVPLNYNMVDQKTYFKKFDKEDIDKILESLKSFDKISWPYDDYNLESVDWIINTQPITQLQIRYRIACDYSSALLIELLPWCLLLNTLGCTFAITANERELCSVSHHGIVTPPKLENTFNIAIELDGSWHMSPLLQLSRPDWSQSFYMMPKINGFIPLEGSVKVAVDCKSCICLLLITSSILDEMRILHVSSSYVIANYTELNLNVVCLAFPDQSKVMNIPNNLLNYSLNVAPDLDKSNTGIPINKWYTPENIPDTMTDYNLHIIVTTTDQTVRSGPIRVDSCSVRKSICLYSVSECIPLVFITQEYKNKFYLSLHHDYHPQFLINNQCNVDIFCAECDDVGAPMLENKEFEWICCIHPNTETCYTMPYVSDKFPAVDENPGRNLIISINPKADSWSKPINIDNFTEQYITIPNYGDVKFTIKKISYTLLIVIDSVTKVEICAQEIRSRLFLQSTAPLIQSKLPITKDASTNTIPIDSASSSFTSISSIDESSATANNKKILWPDRSTKAMSIKTAFKENCLPNKKEWNIFKLALYIKNVTFVLTVDSEDNNFEPTDASTWSCDNIGLTLTKNQKIDCCITSSNFQWDNQLFDRGCYDFPVVLVGENALDAPEIIISNKQVMELIEETRENRLMTIDLHIETWLDQITEKQITEIKDIKINFGPLLAYIEDTYVTKLMEYINVFSPTELVIWSYKKRRPAAILLTNTNIVEIPEHLIFEAKLLSKPLNINSLIIETCSVLLSVHSSLKIYIALDRSPLHFSRFERKNIVTTSYRLGHALTMHYISGAIFGAGWVVGSLELLGSPSGLARSFGNGLRDFVSLPYYGLIQGPWAFLVGITHGSKSLMCHITAGTLDSVTKLAASIARNLDRLTMDEEHQRRTEEQRRHKPQGAAQGFMQGLTGLGISLLGAVGGIAHHPLQSVMNQGASPRGLAAGVGLGLVGVITKPLSGAAELVALTGQGLLHGTGWNRQPEPRISRKNRSRTMTNSVLKYKWKFLRKITLHTNLYAIINAIYETNQIALILTYETLIIFNTNEDVIQKTVSLTEINGIDDVDDPTSLRIILVENTPASAQNIDQDIEMDPVSRARITDYVKNAAGLVLGSVSNQSEFDISPIPSRSSTPSRNSIEQPLLTFIVNPQNKNYFCNVLTFLKLQRQDNIFSII